MSGFRFWDDVQKPQPGFHTAPTLACAFLGILFLRTGFSVVWIPAVSPSDGQTIPLRSVTLAGIAIGARFALVSDRLLSATENRMELLALGGNPSHRRRIHRRATLRSWTV